MEPLICYEILRLFYEYVPAKFHASVFEECLTILYEKDVVPFDELFGLFVDGEDEVDEGIKGFFKSYIKSNGLEEYFKEIED